MILIFQRECAFTVDIVVVLDILWCSTEIYFLSLPYEGDEPVSPDEEWIDKIRGRGLAYPVYAAPAAVVALWLWLRMATVGEIDFEPTPGGTSFFLVTRVSPESLKMGSRAMVFFLIWVQFVSHLRGIGSGVHLIKAERSICAGAQTACEAMHPWQHLQTLLRDLSFGL